MIQNLPDSLLGFLEPFESLNYKEWDYKDFSNCQAIYREAYRKSQAGQSAQKEIGKLAQSICDAENSLLEKRSPKSTAYTYPTNLKALFTKYYSRSIYNHGNHDKEVKEFNKLGTIGHGLRSGYKGNNISKEIKIDSHTAATVRSSSDQLYTSGWSARGHFDDGEE